MFRRHFQEQERARILSNRVLSLLLLTQVMALGLHASRIPPWLAIICLILLAWRAWLIREGARNRPGRGLKNVLALGTLGVFTALSGWQFSVETAIAFFLLTYSLKLLELKTYRDGFLFICLSFFLLALVFLFGQGLLETLVVGAALMIPLTALRLLHEYEPKRGRSLPLQVLRSASLLAWALPLLVLLYVAFPRVGPLWSMPLKTSSGFTGLSERMSPGQIADLAGSSKRAFRARFQGSQPAKTDLYWRAIILDAYDGGSWTRSNYQRARDSSIRRQWVGEDAWDYEVMMEAHNQRWGFGLDGYDVVMGDPGQTADGLVWFNKTVKAPTRYRQALGMSSEHEAQRWRMTQIPADENPRTRAKVNELLGLYRDDESFIRAWLKQYRELPFYYTLQPPLLPGRDGIDQFLFDTRRGFCEHYASSTAFALRVAGIPSRVVTGYQGGQFNANGGFWTIYQYDAHAWVEAWLEGQGWVRVDPTAEVAPARIESRP